MNSTRQPTREDKPVLDNYGVWKGHAIERRLGAGSSPHYQIHLIDENDHFRVAVNVMSQVSPSEVGYLIDDRFRHHLTDTWEALPT